MKIGINDGCANGGMMDSLSISPKEEGDWDPMYVVEVTNEEWAAWEAFLREENKWDLFWDGKCREATRKKKSKPVAY